MTWWKARFAQSERGTSGVEYAMIIMGVALGMVAVVGSFHESIAQMWAGVIELM
ncbi:MULTISPECIES: Flp family type IVb pilin [unclassified Aeromicrobium]|uniref:Flp family type IVb pilin n=1 Tax=unclassified Aeromicrobium TaxID=2633570 RepID=UPI00396B3DB1